MATNKRILIAVDMSGSSRRAVNYVVDMVGGRQDVHVGLLHLELPPRMLEWGGSEDPEIEHKIASERAGDYQQMEKEAIGHGQDLLKSFQDILAARSIDVTARLVQFEEPLEPKNITNHVLKIAGERDYGTVVVGRHSFSGLQRLYRHQVSEELVRAANGIAVWVVECKA